MIEGAELASQLAQLDQSVDDSVRIDRIRQLEELKSIVAAAQARETAAFVASQRREQIARGVPAERVGRGVAAQVGLARRISPFEASRYVRQVQALTADLPETFVALSTGRLTERRALRVAQETGWLSSEHRSAVDATIAPQLTKLGTRRLVDLVRQAAYRLDPAGALARLSIAERERHVSVRPAADAMARLVMLLPLTQAVGAYAALRTEASSKVGVGDETRTLAQLMADTAVQRLTGLDDPRSVPVEVHLIMTDQTLLGGGDQPAQVVGGGTVPAEIARRAVTDSAAAFVRRLYADGSGTLAAVESRGRFFTEAQRRLLVLRDQVCRTPWCDAPVRHADHIVPVEHGGATTVANGQGLCEACNYAKTAEGWAQRRERDEIVTTTPTGNTYRSRDPIAA